MTCKHVPHKVIASFEDAWYGSIKIGNYERGYTYEPIVCRNCGVKIKANKDLTKWEELNEKEIPF